MQKGFPSIAPFLLHLLLYRLTVHPDKSFCQQPQTFCIGQLLHLLPGGHRLLGDDAAVLYKLNPADCLTLCHRCLKLFAKLQLYFDAIRLIFLYHRLWQHLDLRLHLRLHPLLDRYRMQPVLRQLRLV